MPEVRPISLPEVSAFLAGRGPVDSKLGTLSEHIQIYYRRGDDLSVDERSHAHRVSDEFFVVLSGSIVLDVEGEEVIVGPRQSCHFPVGVFHRIVDVFQPLEVLVIRAPSADDKVYR